VQSVTEPNGPERCLRVPLVQEWRRHPRGWGPESDLLEPTVCGGCWWQSKQFFRPMGRPRRRCQRNYKPRARFPGRSDRLQRDRQARLAVINDPQGASFIASQFVPENKDLTA